MALAGAKPKPAGQAVTRHKQVHEWTEIENVPFAGGRKLPPRRPGGQVWPKRTREKWETWRTMPHAKLWGPAEWDYALDCIEIAAKFHEGDARQATELRNREKVLGTTMDFRRDLRIRYIEPEAPRIATVTSIESVRDL